MITNEPKEKKTNRFSQKWNNIYFFFFFFFFELMFQVESINVLLVPAKLYLRRACSGFRVC